MNEILHQKRSRRRALTACGAALLLACALQSCEKDILEGQPEWLGNSIYERLQEGIEVNGEKKSFNVTLRLIDDLDQKAVMSRTGSRTLFVSSDEAYAEWFKNNDWGVSSYEQLTKAQKKMLLNHSMITNAYLLELMSNVSGNPPQEGLCMRRSTSASIYDSVQTMGVAEMPNNPMLQSRLDSWATLREAGKDIRILKNDVAAPMIHFLPEFMSKNKISDSDLAILTNGRSTSISDSWINGKKVIGHEQTCKNGYIYVVDGVIESNKNMAEIINAEAEMSGWAALMNRFSAPFAATGSVLADYQRLYNTNDTCYVLRYFSKRSYGELALSRTPQGYSVPATLTFDPGMNQYMWANTMGYDMHYDAGAMIVPTNEALDRWWNNAGKGLQEEYGSWENVPALTLSKLLNVNMLSSFVDAVPSKFSSIVDDSKVELGIKTSDVERCYMGCNGVIYLVNKVFAPSEYRSVVYPALAHQSTLGVIYYAIDNYDFGPYLNSMDSRFSLILPYNTQPSALGNKKVFRYLDPCTYGLSTQTLFEFYFDEESQMVACDRYQVTIDPETQVATYISKLSSLDAQFAVVSNRLSDLVDNLIIVGDIESGQTYYKTKAGSVIKVTGSGSDIRIQGGYQMEQDRSIEVKTIYDMTEGGNGKSYGVESLPLTASKSVYQILREAAEAEGSTSKLFFQLLADDGTNDAILSSTTGSSTIYYCANDDNNKNIRLFENYNYTVYVPTDASIQKMIDDGYLPTWEDWESYSDAADRGDRTAMAAQDSIANIIHSFVRYHLQDNAIYIGGTPTNGERYETSKLNPKNNRFFSLQVTSDANSMTVKDQAGNVRRVVKDKGLYNKTSREYWISGRSTAAQRLIYSSSNAVVQQIDGVLLYDPALQQTPWKNHLPANN